MTGDAPTFSVVIPALNLERTIGGAIRSVIGQTRQDFEVIVVDDGSTDGTAEVVESFANDARIRILRGQRAGVAAARNAGVLAGRGALVALLDGDDLWLPTFLEEMGDALARDTGARFAYTDAWVWAEWHQRMARSTGIDLLDPPRPVPTDASGLFLELIRRNFVLSTAVIRREVFDDVGFFRTSLRACSDYEYWLRITARGGRGVFVPGPLAVYRRRRDSITGDTGGLSDSSEEVRRIVVEEYRLPDDLRASARAALAVSAPVDSEGAAGRAGRWAGRRARGFVSFLIRPFRWYLRPPRRLLEAFPDVMLLLDDPQGSYCGAGDSRHPRPIGSESSGASRRR